MENNNEKNGFEVVKPNQKSNYRKKEVKMNNSSGSHAIRHALISFICGILGAALVIGLVFFVPPIKENLFGTSSSSSKKQTSFTVNSGPVSSAIDIEDYSNTTISVANKVLPSVVGIEVSFDVQANYPTFYARTQSTQSTASGSGVIISNDGYILTNNHIINTSTSSTSYYTVSDANEVLIYIYGEDEPVKAEIIGSDSVTDLAVLKVDRTDLTPIEFGDSDSVQIGELVIAVGNPLEMNNTVTAGILSGKDREIDDDDSSATYTLLQTNAAINASNSGGALVNADGKLIGINTLKLAGTGIEGMGIAIPINSTYEITKELIDNGEVTRPYLGISGQDVTEYESRYYDVPVGIYIVNIEKDGSAKNSDLKPGDVITKFNGEEVKTMAQLNKLKYKCKVGDVITLTVQRENDSKDYEELEVKVTLTEQK